MDRCKGNIVSLGRVKPSEAVKAKLFEYASEGKCKKLQHLLSGPNIQADSPNTRGQTALFVTCMKKHLKCVSLLLHWGANPNRRCDDGSTAVHAAAFSCLPSILRAIVKSGGDLRLHDDRNLLPRDWALEAGTKRNKQILHLIDGYQDDVMREVISMQAKSSTSFSRYLQKSSSETSLDSIQAQAKTVSMDNTGYGSFISLQVISDTLNKHQRQRELGFCANIAIIGSDEITDVECETISMYQYQAPPQFVISSGTWGVVPVTTKQKKVAKKTISVTRQSPNDLFIHEMRLLGIFRHPNILLLLGVCLDMDEMEGTKLSRLLKPQLLLKSFVYERVSVGSLYSVFHENNYQLAMVDKVELLLQIGEALSYVHQRGFIHCCVSSHAVHMINFHTAKLSDFYYTTHSKDNAPIQNRISSAFNRWLAPELLAEKKPCFESDVYSYCVLACETFTGMLPWKGFDADSVRHQIVSKGRTLVVPKAVPRSLHGAFSKGLSLSRSKRNIKLLQVMTVIRALAKSDLVLQESMIPNGFFGLTSQDEIDNNHTSSFSRIQSLDKPDGGLGIDISDAVPFLTTNTPPKRQISQRSAMYGDANPRSSLFDHVQAISSTNQSSFHKFSPANTKVSCHLSPGLPPGTPQQTSATDDTHFCGDLKVTPTSGQQRVDFRDDEVGVIHPALIDTDSMNTSLASESDEALDYCLNQSDEQIMNEREFDDVLFSHQQHQEQDPEADGRTEDPPTGVAGEAFDREKDLEPLAFQDKSRASPYPDLSDCKDSLGNYVLSGMSNQDYLGSNYLEAERSSLSVGTSYLDPIYSSTALVQLVDYNEPPSYTESHLDKKSGDQEANPSPNSLSSPHPNITVRKTSRSRLPPRPSSANKKENQARPSPASRKENQPDQSKALRHRYSQQRKERSLETEIKEPCHQDKGRCSPVIHATVASPVQPIQTAQRSREEFSEHFQQPSPVTEECGSRNEASLGSGRRMKLNTVEQSRQRKMQGETEPAVVQRKVDTAQEDQCRIQKDSKRSDKQYHYAVRRESFVGVTSDLRDSEKRNRSVNLSVEKSDCVMPGFKNAREGRLAVARASVKATDGANEKIKSDATAEDAEDDFFVSARIQGETSNFADEVLSAAGFDSEEVGSLHRKRAPVKPARVLSADRIQQKASKSKQKKSRRARNKQGAAEKKRAEGGTSNLRAESAASANDNVAVLFKSFPQESARKHSACSARSGKAGDSTLGQQQKKRSNRTSKKEKRRGKESSEGRAKAVDAEESEHRAPYPSGFDSADDEDLEVVFRQFVNRKGALVEAEAAAEVGDKDQPRRFSITSADLEDIFGDFAERKPFYHVENNSGSSSDQISQCDGTEETADSGQSSQGYDVTDSAAVTQTTATTLDIERTLPYDLSPMNAGMFDRFSQTSPRGTNVQVAAKSQSMPQAAKYPPSISQFLARTGDWSCLSQTDRSPAADQPSQREEATQCPETQPLKRSNSVGTQVCWQPTESSGDFFPCVLRNEDSGSRMTAVRATGELTAAPQTPPSSGEKRFEVTPSKWSFRQKLTAFEARFAEMEAANEALVSPRRANEGECKASEDAQVNSAALREASPNDEDRQENPLYVTALEGQADQSNTAVTPANARGLLAKIVAEKGVKTSTPVTSKGICLSGNTRPTTVAANNANLNESYTDVHGIRESATEQLSHAPSTANPDTPSRYDENLSKLFDAGTDSSSLLHVSLIPRSNFLPDVSTESNATFCGEHHPNPIFPQRVQNSFEEPKSQYLEAVATVSESIFSSVTSETMSNESGSKDSMTKAMNSGISKLSSSLTSEVIHDQALKLSRENSYGEQQQELTEEFSSISYDEEEVGIPEAKSQASAAKSTAAECDTSVWADSQASSYGYSKL